MNKLEKQLQTKINNYCNELEANKIIDYHNKIIVAAKNGIPDKLIVIKGITYYFELKREDKKGKLSKIQEYVINKLNQNKKVAFVIDNFDKFKSILEELCKK